MEGLLDIDLILRELQEPAKLRIVSTSGLANEVEAKAKEARADSPGVVYLKTPAPVDVPMLLDVSAAEVLRELGVATTFLTNSPFVPTAQMWAQVRYCATLRPGRGRFLSLTDHAATDVVHHHKVAQSEQIGIGLALVVARTALQRRHPDFVFQVVDADVALNAGYIEDVPEKVESAPETKKRPDYFLIGRRRGNGRARLHIAVLECKGTHGRPSDVVKQLGDACLQVRTVAIGRRRMYGLMVGSLLSRNGITSYILDPPGEDELWDGTDEEFDSLLADEPDEPRWAPQSQQPSPSGAPAGTGPPEPPAPYSIPADRSGWFAQVLTRSTAASVLLYAGDGATAAHYLTPRQRGHEPGMIPALEQWPDTTTDTVRLDQDIDLRGTTYRMPLPDGRSLEVFRGIEQTLHHDLAEGHMLSYLRHAGRLRRWWRGRRTRQAGQLMSVGHDGTALLMRIVSDRDTRHG